MPTLTPKFELFSVSESAVLANTSDLNIYRYVRVVSLPEDLNPGAAIMVHDFGSEKAVFLSHDRRWLVDGWELYPRQVYEQLSAAQLSLPGSVPTESKMFLEQP